MNNDKRPSKKTSALRHFWFDNQDKIGVPYNSRGTVPLKVIMYSRYRMLAK